MATELTPPALTATEKKVPTFAAPAREWWQAIAFCLLISLVGLQLFPALIPIALFLAWRWGQNRYAFLVELLLVMGDYGFKHNFILPFKLSDLALVAGVIGLIIYRKNKDVKRITLSMLAYFAVLILIASTSLEKMSIQFVMMRNYMIIIAFFIPLLTFANRSFSWEKMIHSIVLHALVICGFYAVDTFIFHGYLLLPGTFASEILSSFFSPVIYPDLLYFPRHYPYGLYWLLLCVMPMTYGKLRFSPWQWVLILLSLFAARTNSLLFALLVCAIFFRPSFKQTLRFALIGLVAIVAGYYIDGATGRNLRLADNIDQFSSLEAAQDDVDLAEFGTGRMAQILPKWELLTEMDRLDVGFGFLHPTLTTNPKFQIRNDYYTDVSRADELATAVEVTQVQTILDCGYLGLAAQFAFYIGIFFILRRRKYSRYYLCAFVGVSMLGIGGFAGVTQRDGLLILALALGMVILANKPTLESEKK